MSEIFKNVTIEGFEHLYKISNFGCVMSLHKKNYQKIITPSICRGYLQVCLKNKKMKRTITIHRLVALAFIPNNDNKEQVDHIDGNKSNNNVKNLRWSTAFENTHNPVTEEKVKATKKWIHYETCEKESRKYTNRADFWRFSRSAYRQALKNNWLDKFTWLVPQCNKKGFWTYQKCKEEALKYKTFYDFEKNSVTAAQKSRKMGWIKDFVWLKPKKKERKIIKWTFLNCFSEALKYHKKIDFRNKSNVAYQSSVRRKWLQMFYWLD